MKRRSFVQFLGLAVLPLPNIATGASTSGEIRLLNKGRVEQVLPIQFQWNSKIVAIFSFTEAQRIDSIELHAPELAEPRRIDVLCLNCSPGMTLEVSWTITTAT